MDNRLRIFISVVIVSTSFNAVAQISGCPSVVVNNTCSYSYHSPTALGNPFWQPSAGTVMSQSNSNNTYTAVIKWTSAGEDRTLKFFNFSTQLAITYVDVCSSSGQSSSVTISNPGTVCQGSNVSFTATPTNGGLSPSYVWKVNSVTKQSGSSNAYSSTTLMNNDVVSVTMTSSNSCFSVGAPATRTMVVSTPPSFGSFTSTNGVNFCSPGTINLNLSSHTGSLAWQHREKDGNGSWSAWATFSTTQGNTNTYSVGHNGVSTRSHQFRLISKAFPCDSAVSSVLDAFCAPVPSNASASALSRVEPGTSTIWGTVPAGATTCRWYDAATGGNLLSTSNDYYPTLTGTTTFWVTGYYQNAPYCEGARTSVVAHVYPAAPQVSPTSGTLNIGESVTLSVTNGPYASYTWWLDGNIVGTNATIDASIPGSYRVEGTKTGMTGSSFSSYVTIGRAFDNQNAKHYVIANHVKTSGVTIPAHVDGLPIEGRSRTVKYVGGLGNTLQVISSSSSPLKKDVVQTPKYDVLGRQLVQYMPYVSSVNDSKFRGNALDNAGYTNSEQYAFYQQTAMKRAVDTKPYLTTEVEASPLQRVTGQTGVGVAWYTANKKVTKQYLLNRAGDNIRLWKVVSGLPTSSASYTDYQLYVNVATDENGNITKTYTDKVGHVVQKDVQSGASTWLKTCYVYDDFGRLAYAITPEGVRTLPNFSPTQAFLDSWAFQYRYDSFGRVVETKPPGADWQFTIYDQLDRVAMTQSGDQRTRNEWTFTKYDVHGRSVAVGYKVISGSRATMQTNVDAQSYNYENVSADATGYTLNRTYPSASATDLLSVTYYDNYDFIGYSGWDAEAHTFSFLQELGATTTTSLLTGLPTGGKLRVVTNATPSALWLNAVQYYDADGRPVQVVSENHLGGLDRTTFIYDFEGKVLKTKNTHSPNSTTSVITQQQTNYDHAGRIKSISHRVGEPVKWVNPVNVTATGSNLTKTSGAAGWDAGAFSQNSLAAGQDGWVEFGVDNTSTYRMLGFSDQDVNASYSSIDYALYIHIDGQIYVYESGSYIGFFGNYTASDRFQVERKNGTIYYKKNGVTFYTSLVPSAGALFVDASLYSPGTSLLDVTIGEGTLDRQIAAYEYNEVGQLVDKKLHSVDGGTTFVQSVDYRYRIRGWLSSINNASLDSDGGTTNDDANDYFGMTLVYNEEEPALGNTGLFNGNISAIRWKGPGQVSGFADRQSYKFGYDKSGRILTATSQMYTGSAWTKEANVKNETISYDDNGNIKTLQRNQPMHQLSGVVASYVSETVDNLTYTYKGTNGNQIDKVEDATGKAAGFANGSSVAAEFTYNAEGSITADKNKGIDSVKYNVLGKPWKICFSDGRRIEYTYSSSGSKLVMKVYQGAVLKKTTDYAGGFVYRNDTLDFFASPEGRVVKKGNNYEYQYAIADHQGNTRVVFSSVTPAPVGPTATFEDPAADALNYLNIPNASPYWETFIAANSTPGGSKVVRMNQNFKIGPAKSLKVYPGDKVDMSVSSYFENASGFGTASQGVATLITAVSAAFGGISGGPGEAGAIYDGVEDALTAFGTGVNQGDTRPEAYLNYILFDKDYKFLNMGWQVVPATSMTKATISISTVNITQPGYIFVYLSYENQSNNYVCFDDFKVTHTKTNILQYNEYYPFGLQTANSWTRDDASNKYLYNGGNELNENSGWYETFFRGYDAALGRFMQVDPLASLYNSYSPYHFAYNNPVMFNDPFGAEADSTGYDGGGGTQRFGPGSGNHWSDQYRSVAGNYMMMSTGTFQSFYGTTNADGFINYQRAGEVAGALARGGIGSSPSGTAITLPGGQVLTSNGDGTWTGMGWVVETAPGLQATLTYGPITINGWSSNTPSGRDNLWNAFVEGATNARTDMIMPSGAMTGFSAVAQVTNLAVRNDAKYYVRFSNLRKVAQASRYVRLTGAGLGIGAVIVAGIESGLDKDGFTWGDAAKLGIGATVTTLSIVGSPVVAGAAVIYGIADLGFGLFTEASLTDRFGSGIDNMMK